ncbi:MAG: hypothetical protein V3R27_11040 [Pseudomonadales bacterium]
MQFDIRPTKGNSRLRDSIIRNFRLTMDDGAIGRDSSTLDKLG